MSDELVTPENVSKEMLRSMFAAASLETSFDRDGDLVVSDGVFKGFVLLDDKNRSIKLMVVYDAEPSATKSDLLEFVNRINYDYMIICAVFVPEHHTVCFDFYICLTGGVSQANIVYTTKCFLRIPLVAVKKHGSQFIK
ncbi:MAG: YbjN domain-containing protein [Patescibacteria group bacterium]